MDGLDLIGQDLLLEKKGKSSQSVQLYNRPNTSVETCSKFR